MYQRTDFVSRFLNYFLGPPNIRPLVRPNPFFNGVKSEENAKQFKEESFQAKHKPVKEEPLTQTKEEPQNGVEGVKELLSPADNNRPCR